MRRFVVLASIFLLAGAGFVTANNRTDLNYQPPGNQGPAVEAGADNCPGTPITGPLPYNDSGDTCVGTNTVTNYGGTCTLSFPYGGEDLIYEISLGTGNDVGFSADIEGSTGDLALFLISTCGDGASCVINSQDTIGPGNGPEVIAAAPYAPGTYYLYVDSYYNAGTAGSCGTYALDVTGTVPAELLSFTAE